MAAKPASPPLRTRRAGCQRARWAEPPPHRLMGRALSFPEKPAHHVLPVSTCPSKTSGPLTGWDSVTALIDDLAWVRLDEAGLREPLLTQGRRRRGGPQGHPAAPGAPWTLLGQLHEDLFSCVSSLHLVLQFSQTDPAAEHRQ